MGQIRDLLPLLKALPVEARAAGLALDTEAEALRHLDATDAVVASLLDALVECLLAEHKRALVGQLPGLRRWRDEPLLPLLYTRRARNIAARSGIATLGDLGEYSPQQLFDLRQAGTSTVADYLRASLIAGLFGPPNARVESITLSTEDEEEGEVEKEDAVDPRMPAALGALASLRTVAAWAADRGLATLGSLRTLDTQDMPTDIHMRWAELTGLEPATIAAAHATERTCGELIDELLAVLPEQRRAVFCQRALDLDRPTLAEVGVSLGVTRARIGQIQDKAIAGITTALESDRFAPLRWRAHTLRIGLGATAPLESDVTNSVLDTVLADVKDDSRGIATRLLLWMAGPYRLREGWLEREDASLPEANALIALADDVGLMPLAEANAWLISRGLLTPFHDAWIDRTERFRRVDDRLAVWSGGVADKSALLLALRGRPATADELVAEIGEGHSVVGTRNRFFADDRFVRVNRFEWALRSWGLEEYTGITDEISQRIQEAGGTARLADIIDAVSAQFNVRAGSVKAYADAPMFLVENGWIRLRGDDEPYVVTDAVSQCRGVFAGGPHHVSMLLPIDREVLRGSGRPCPPAVAGLLGVTPGQRATFAWQGGALLLSWPVTAAFGPALGSVRSLASDVAATEGDSLRLDFDASSMSVTATRVPQQTPGLAPLERLQLLTGLEQLGEQDALEQLAAALLVSPREVRRHLVERGDAAVAELLPAAQVDGDLAAALSELARALEEGP